MQNQADPKDPEDLSSSLSSPHLLAPSPANSRSHLRSILLAKRQAITAQMRMQYDAAIGAQVIAWSVRDSIKSLGVYWPIRAEPDLRAIYPTLVAHGVQLALPVVVDKQAPLRFLAWTPGDELCVDALGITAPRSNAAIVQPQALLIPCVGFNRQQMRLGYGGGFYDRTLALQPRPFALGIAYACTLTTFDAAAHDVAMDLIITDEDKAEDKKP